MEGMHMCSMMCGVKKSQAKMITSAISGYFKTNSKTRSEFMTHIGRRKFGAIRAIGNHAHKQIATMSE